MTALAALTTILFIFTSTLLQSRTAHARLHTNNDGTIQEQYVDESDFRVRYIFAIGSEGTGHHSSETTLYESPQQLMLRKLGLHYNQTRTCKVMWNLIMHGCERYSHGRWFDKRRSNKINYNLLVKSIKDLDDRIKENKSYFDGEGTKEKGIMNVHINLMDGCTVSFPAFSQKECRDQQYIHLHMFYKACSEINVDCGHIVMVRNAFDVWSSTVLRKHDKPVRLAHTLALKLDSIASQMLVFGHRLVACLDYDDPEKELATSNVQNLLGWNNVPNGDLDSALKRYYSSSHHPHTMKEMAKYYPEEANLYIESMAVSTNLIRKLCKEQLQKNLLG